MTVFPTYTRLVRALSCRVCFAYRMVEEAAGISAVHSGRMLFCLFFRSTHASIGKCYVFVVSFRVCDRRESLFVYAM